MTKISETEIKSMTKEQNYLRGYNDGKLDVLDKIRAEINSLHNGCGLFNDGVDASLKAIDKYRNGEQK